MNIANVRSSWSSVRSEGRAYPWKNSLLRMAADVILVNFSMLTAFALWFLFYVVILRTPDPQGLAERFKNFVTHYWLLWSFLALLVFQLSGFYPGTRDAGGVQKTIAVFRGVSSFIVLFVFADYFLYRGALVPRGVAVLAWILTLATVGGVRLTKHKILKRYHFERKSDPESVRQVLVLGGGGYLGSVVVARLLQNGYGVRVLDSFLFGEGALEGVRAHAGCELVRGDVRDIGAVVKAMRGCDAVVHLAAIVGDPACDDNKQLAMEVNRAATRMLADVASGCGVRRFVFASSCGVYGESEMRLDETSAVNPLSVYAQTKVDSENILLAATRHGDGFATGSRQSDSAIGLATATAQRDAPLAPAAAPRGDGSAAPVAATAAVRQSDGAFSAAASAARRGGELGASASGVGFAPTILRLGTLFGLSPRMRFDLVVNLFVARAASSGKITVLNGEQWRPFLHVQDAARAVVACLEAETSAVSGEIFNVGSASLNLQIEQLGAAIARVVPGTEIVRIENGDRRNYRVSFEKIEKTLNFQCERTLESGIEEIYAAIQSGRIADFTIEQFNNQTAMRAMAAAAGGTLAPLGQLSVLERAEAKPF
jgi:nucleoside-diphosphate-sugar epimerase